MKKVNNLKDRMQSGGFGFVISTKEERQKRASKKKGFKKN